MWNKGLMCPLLLALICSVYADTPVSGAVVTFPGLRENVLELLETGYLHQRCFVDGSAHDEYRYQWLSPDGHEVSDNAELIKDYLRRPADEGIYQCLATPTQDGSSPVTKNLTVTIAPLQTAIFIVADELKTGGFATRRAYIMQPIGASFITNEKFILTWFGPKSSFQPIGFGQKLHVTFTTSEDFGEYTLQVQGVSSRYYQKTVIKLTPKRNDVISKPQPGFTRCTGCSIGIMQLTIWILVILCCDLIALN